MELKIPTRMRPLCAAAGCSNQHYVRGFCRAHYERMRRSGALAARTRLPNGSGYRRRDGYLTLEIDGVKKLEHVVIAERAIGKPLPTGAEVHHVDEDPKNNAPGNLVVCPDAAYHKLLHQRQRAFDACGHYHWRKCQFCGRYDEPANLWTSRKKAYHRACAALARRAFEQDKRAAAAR